jgi:hypothetical protein
MMTSREMPLTLAAAVRAGLESLTVTGPSPVLESIYREALKAVTQRPSQHEREQAISRAWLASSRATQLMQEGNRPAAMQIQGEMYSLVRAAISASRLT